GEIGFAHLRVQEPTLVLPRDRFIIRQFSPVITVGGGVVLDNLARRPAAKDSGRVDFLKTLEKRDNRAILRAMTLRSLFGLSQQEIAARTGWTDESIQETARLEQESGNLRIVGQSPLLLVGPNSFTDLRSEIMGAVESFDKANPLSSGMARDDLRVKAGRRVRQEVFRAALEELSKQQKLVLQGETVKRAGAEVTLLPEELRARDQIETAFAGAGPAVPPVKEGLAQLPVEAKRGEKLLQLHMKQKK